MFSVIGVGGGVFRGSLEHLLAAHRVPPLRHLRGIDQDVDGGCRIPVGLRVGHDRSWSQSLANVTSANSSSRSTMRC